MTTPLLLESQVAELLGCSVDTLQRKVRSGALRATRFGDGGYVFSYRLLVEDVEKACESSDTPPEPAASAAVLVPVPAKRSLPDLRMVA